MAVQFGRGKKGESSQPAAASSVRLHGPDVMKKIAETAYYLWEKRGRPHGNDMQDWLEAEKLILGKKS
jgi:hypothetical protein